MESFNIKEQSEEENCLMYIAFLKEIGCLPQAKTLCLKYLKSKAYYLKNDMLSLFYGSRVYDFDELPSEETIEEYVQIVEELKNIYDMICNKEAATNKEGNPNPNGWVEQNQNALRDVFNGFFKWLAEKKVPSYGDLTIFNSFCATINSSTKLGYRMSRNVARLPLVKIIEGVVNQSIKVDGLNGELS